MDATNSNYILRSKATPSSSFRCILNAVGSVFNKSKLHHLVQGNTFMEPPIVVYSTPPGQSASGNDLSPGTGVKPTPSVTPASVKDKARDANKSGDKKRKLSSISHDRQRGRSSVRSLSPKGTKSGDKKRKLSSKSPDRQRGRSSLRSSSPIVNGYSSSRRAGSVRRSPDPKRFLYRRCPSAPPESWR